ncbi:MAG: OB-fold nucleic acid binding domain-containing protein [Prevotella sp.]|nr:OB-fold nucleic acid binding domain-containing protein [Prevotella sp.]
MKKTVSILMASAIALGVLTACEDVPMPYNNPLDEKPEEEVIVIEPTGSGTEESPYNVAAAINYVTTLGADVTSSVNIYIKGVVTSVSEPFGTQYGNATFVLSDTEEGTNKFTFWRGLYLGNKKYTSGTNIEEGDIVTVCGKVVLYGGSTPETSQGNAYVYSINGEKAPEVPDTPTAGDAKGSGTQADPFNVAAAIAKCIEIGETASSNDYYAKGIITEISDMSSLDKSTFGNATFKIADSANGETAITIYRAYSLGGEKFKTENEIKVGDEVVICGKLVNFRGNTPEFTQGCYIYSLNGSTTGGSSAGDEAKAVTIAEFNAASESTSVWYKLTGKVSGLKDSDQYGNFDLVDETGSVYVYGVLSEKGGAKKQFQELAAAKGIKEGSTLTIIGNRGSYNGKIEVMNAYFVSVSN